MYTVRVITDVSECRAVWEEVIPRESIWDLWEVRDCFHRHYQRPLHFIVASEKGRTCGLLPLSWIEEAGIYGYFPGETWNGTTWLEQNRICDHAGGTWETLLDYCPGAYHLRYLRHPGAGSPKECAIDEVGYLFSPPHYEYDIENYFGEFSRKSRKRLRHDLDAFEKRGLSYRFDEMEDFDQLVKLNEDRFGADSYFSDRRFTKSFRSLMELLQDRGWMRITTVMVAGEIAAVDLGCIFNGVYTLLGGARMKITPVWPRSSISIIYAWLVSESSEWSISSAAVSPGRQSSISLPVRFIFWPAKAGRIRPDRRSLKMRTERVLVVGTTPDYIDAICHYCPDRALFLTGKDARAGCARSYRQPDLDSEVLCDLSRFVPAVAALEKHLKRFRIHITGITCFDCESLALASHLAAAFSLPFVSPEAVAASRNKFTSRRLWQAAGLPCPKVCLVRSPTDAIRFLGEVKQPVVLKPLTGSGSELIFPCRDVEDCLDAFHTLLLRLRIHPNRRMYDDQWHGGERIDPHRAFVIEELVEGEEFSCDFILGDEGPKIIRITKKIPARDQMFGTTGAYILVNELPPEIDLGGFCLQVGQAARALGISRAICMLDFIVAHGKAMMLEMTPRPGGDCLPSLERLSSGFDILGYALDFAEGRESAPPAFGSWQPLVGLHLLAEESGVVRRIDVRNLREDHRVLECRLDVVPSHRVIMPPEDYNSRRLGHAIFKPDSFENADEECLDLLGKVIVEMDPAR